MQERFARYVIDAQRRQCILENIKNAWDELEKGNIQLAKSYYYESQHHFSLARYNNQVIFYKKVHAVVASIAFLIFYFGIAATGIWYPPIRNDAFVFPALLALSGGGLGGVTAVLSKIVGLRLKTQAITTQSTWYSLKPVLGAVMGLVTYVALLSSLSLLSYTYQIDNFSGIFLVGFLGGYLESFSTRILSQVADTLANVKTDESIYIEKEAVEP